MPFRTGLDILHGLDICGRSEMAVLDVYGNRPIVIRDKRRRFELFVVIKRDQWKIFSDFFSGANLFLRILSLILNNQIYGRQRFFKSSYPGSKLHTQVQNYLLTYLGTLVRMRPLVHNWGNKFSSSINFHFLCFLWPMPLWISHISTQTMNIKSITLNSIAMFSLKPYTLAGLEPGSCVP
jgi:hypothetical protein